MEKNSIQMEEGFFWGGSVVQLDFEEIFGRKGAKGIQKHLVTRYCLDAESGESGRRP